MHTPTGLVRTGLLWLAGAEEQTVDKLTAAHSSTPPHHTIDLLKAPLSQTVTHTNCLSRTFVWLLRQAHSMTHTCQHMLIRTYARTFSLSTKLQKLHTKRPHSYAHTHVRKFCSKKKEQLHAWKECLWKALDTTVRGSYLIWLHVHGRLENSTIQRDLCVKYRGTYVVVRDISLITDTHPFHCDKDWARTQEWTIRGLSNRGWAPLKQALFVLN